MQYLYLDHRDLIDLTATRNQKVLDHLRQLSESEKVLVVLSLEHLFETWRGNDVGSRRKLANVADSLKPIWVLSRGYLHAEEARAALWQYLGVPTERYWPESRAQLTGGGLVTLSDGTKRYRISVFRHSIADTFKRNGDRMRTGRDELGAADFARMLELLEQLPDVPNALKALSEEAYPDATVRFRQEYSKDLPGMDLYVSWVLDRACEGIALDPLVRVDFLKTLDLHTCPSMYSMIHVKNQINREKIAKVDASEMADVVHVSALPYVDLFSADKRICDFIRRAKLGHGVFHRHHVRQMETCRTLAIAVKRIDETDESQSRDAVDASP